MSMVTSGLGGSGLMIQGLGGNPFASIGELVEAIDKTFALLGDNLTTCHKVMHLSMTMHNLTTVHTEENRT